MKKWYAEEYEFEIEVTGFLHSNHTERYCRNGEEIGDRYTCTYGCPVNANGQGICSKTMLLLFPIMEAIRSGGDLENIGRLLWELMLPHPLWRHCARAPLRAQFSTTRAARDRLYLSLPMRLPPTGMFSRPFPS